MDGRLPREDLFKRRPRPFPFHRWRRSGLKEPSSFSCLEGRRFGNDGAAGSRSGEFSLDEMVPTDPAAPVETSAFGCRLRFSREPGFQAQIGAGGPAFQIYSWHIKNPENPDLHLVQHEGEGDRGHKQTRDHRRRQRCHQDAGEREAGDQQDIHDRTGEDDSAWQEDQMRRRSRTT